MKDVIILGCGVIGAACAYTLSRYDVSVTVPQKLHPAIPQKAVPVFFRVRRTFEKSHILVTDGETVLCAFSRERMSPGEMEQIYLPTALLRRAKGNTLYISCEEVSK